MPGRWRVRFGDPTQLPATLELAFDPVGAEASPGQVAIDASADFFTELNAFVPEGRDLQPVAIADVVAGRGLGRYDTLVVVDDLGSRAHLAEAAGLSATAVDAYFAALRTFAEGGGNVVLTDSALQATADLGLVPADAVAQDQGIAGFYFELDGQPATYTDPARHPLTDGIAVPGAAEGEPGRRQMVEPTPIGYSPDLGLDEDPAMPFWGVDRAAWEAACGRGLHHRHDHARG